MQRHYGAIGVGDLELVEVTHADLALLCADADGRISTGWGAALLDQQLLHLSSQPGGTARPRVVTGVEELVHLLVEAELDRTPRTLAFALDFDLDAPAPTDTPAATDAGAGADAAG